MREVRTSAKLKDRLLRNWSDMTAVEGNLITAAGPSVRTLMVVSGSAGEGRSSAAACLGLSLSANGRTLLIDGHLRKPDLSSRLVTPGMPGLSEVVLDGMDVAGAVYPAADADNLFVRPAGQRLAGPAAMFHSSSFIRLMSHLRQDWDHVVCDTPPLLAESDAALMAAQFDAAVLVLSCGDSRWEVAQVVAERLDAAGGRLIGAVLNRRRYHVPQVVYRRL